MPFFPGEGDILICIPWNKRSRNKTYPLVKHNCSKCGAKVGLHRDSLKAAQEQKLRIMCPQCGQPYMPGAPLQGLMGKGKLIGGSNN